MMTPVQLPLPVALRDGFQFESFYIGENNWLIDFLPAFSRGDDKEKLVYLYGPKESGKTHLLNAVAKLAGQHKRSVAYLPLASISQYPPDVLDEMHQMDVICLDELEAVSGQPDWERALFNLFNSVQAHDGQLLVAANSPPKDNGIVLPDLQSRFASSLVFGLSDLSDEDKLRALKMRAGRRGLLLSEEAGRYLLTHYARGMGQLFTLLDSLDHASLAAKRKLTIPFLKSILK